MLPRSNTQQTTIFAHKNGISITELSPRVSGQTLMPLVGAVVSERIPHRSLGHGDHSYSIVGGGGAEASGSGPVGRWVGGKITEGHVLVTRSPALRPRCLARTKPHNEPKDQCRPTDRLNFSANNGTVAGP